MCPRRTCHGSAPRPCRDRARFGMASTCAQQTPTVQTTGPLTAAAEKSAGKRRAQEEGSGAAGAALDEVEGGTLEQQRGARVVDACQLRLARAGVRRWPRAPPVIAPAQHASGKPAAGMRPGERIAHRANSEPACVALTPSTLSCWQVRFWS